MRFKVWMALLLGVLVVRAGEVPRPAPPLDLMTHTGQKLSLASYKGKVVLLKFFLTECAHCQRTATIIMPVYNEWRARGLEVIGVAINPDARERIPEFIRRFGATFPIALGNSNMVKSFGDLSAVARFSVPYLFLIDRQGVIRHEHPGGDQPFFANESHNLRTELDALLKQPSARKTARKQQ